ncbi:hypothetical protein PSYJA_46336, partial [Pseudomonas syringae pv. japonica str. M301072]
NRYVHGTHRSSGSSWRCSNPSRLRKLTNRTRAIH